LTSTVILQDGGETVAWTDLSTITHVVSTEALRLTVNTADNPLTISMRLDLPDGSAVTTKVVAQDYMIAGQTMIWNVFSLMASMIQQLEQSPPA